MFVKLLGFLKNGQKVLDSAYSIINLRSLEWTLLVLCTLKIDDMHASFVDLDPQNRKVLH